MAAVGLEMAAPLAKKRKADLLLVTAGHFFLDIYMNLVPPLLFLLALEYGLDPAQQGLLVLVLTTTGSTFQPLFGFLVDRGGRAAWLLVSLVWIAAFLTAVGYVGSFAGLLLLVAVGGLGSGITHPLGALVAAQLGGRRKDTAVSYYVTGGNLGYSLAPVVVVAVATGLGLRSLPLLAVPAVLVAGLMLVRGIHRIALPNQEEQGPDPGADANGLKGWRALHGYALPMTLLNTFAALRSCLQVFYGAFVIEYFLLLGYSETIASYALTLVLAAYTLGGMSGGYLCDHFGRRSVITGSLAMATVLFYLFQQADGAAVWVFLLAASFFLTISFPPSIVMGQELMPKHAALASGLVQGFSFGLGSLGSLGLSYLAKLYDLHLAMQMTVPVVGAAVLVAALYFRASPRH